MPPCLCVWRARGRRAGRACWWRSQGMTGHTAAPRLALPAGAGAAPVFLVSPAAAWSVRVAACSGVPAVRVVVGCEPGSATTGPWLLVVEARRGGGGACGGLCDAWCSRPRQGGHGSLTLSPPGECSDWTRRLPVIDMLPAAPRLHEARGRAPWALDWGGPHLLTALGTGGVVVDWTIRPRR